MAKAESATLGNIQDGSNGGALAVEEMENAKRKGKPSERARPKNVR
jgi:hypothetical protein